MTVFSPNQPRIFPHIECAGMVYLTGGAGLDYLPIFGPVIVFHRFLWFREKFFFVPDRIFLRRFLKLID